MEDNLENLSLIDNWNPRGVFLIPWLPMTSILFTIVRFCRSWFKCNYLKNEKHFLNFFFHLWNSHQNLNIFKPKIMVRAHVFPKLQTVKYLVEPLSQNHCFTTPFDSEHVKESQTLVKSRWEHFYHVSSSLWGELIWKISPLVICKILGVFLKTETADKKYLVPDYENLPLPIQMQLP